jgi:hypothetical protein
MKITICGSTTFVRDMTKTKKHLEEKGHEVFVPRPLVTEEWYQENHGRDNLLKMKPIWTQKHFKRIENSNAVLILNNEKNGIAGYLGPNTLMELSVAFYLRKIIFFMNSFEENHPYYEELIALKSIILDGDLSKVK